MGSKRNYPTKGNSPLEKVGDRYFGNGVKVNIEKNSNPQHAFDINRANVRISFECSTVPKKNIPTLYVYSADDYMLQKLEKSLVSALISLRNARFKLADENGIELNPEQLFPE